MTPAGHVRPGAPGRGVRLQGRCKWTRITNARTSYPLRLRLGRAAGSSWSYTCMLNHNTQSHRCQSATAGRYPGASTNRKAPMRRYSQAPGIPSLGAS
jgi:hypothetical protein